MKTIHIHDLARNELLDAKAMSTVRGGHSWGRGVSVNLNVNQSLVQVQDVDLNLLNNNGSIGAGFIGPTVNLSAAQTGFNSAVIPKMF